MDPHLIEHPCISYYLFTELENISSVADVTTHQTFGFDDSEQQFVASVKGQNDRTYDFGSTSDVDLQNWLERPILAMTRLWQVGTPFPIINFNPWEVFLESPTVAQKIQNFYLIRCDMNLKIIVNGSQFHYGRGMVSYRPLLTNPGPNFQLPVNSIPGNGPASFPIIGSNDSSRIIQSQWPHIFIDPGQSMGGEMTFPFFFGGNWLSIPDSGWKMRPTSLLDDGLDFIGRQTNGPFGANFVDLGRIHSADFGNLKHANGADDPVTVQVFLWATNVKLRVPTSMDNGTAILTNRFTRKGNKPKPATAVATMDEYSGAKTKTISETSARVGNAMGALSSLPVIGPYAMATSTMAKAISAAASAMGWSRPGVLEVATNYKPIYLGNLANVDQAENINRLTVDSKQEITVDPRTVGLDGRDEMSMHEFLKRECFFRSFLWRVNEPAETLLFQIKVTPRIAVHFRQPGADNVVGTIPTPLHYVSLPFSYWRGTLRYRMQIVASNLHRGRLRVVYDPLQDGLANANVNLYPEDRINTQYSRTVDIVGDEGRDFTWEVGMCQDVPYLRLPPDSGQGSINRTNFGVPPNGTGGGFAFDADSSCNGVISIYVLNRLAVPNNDLGVNNDVQVNLFVSGNDDFDFQQPTDAELQRMCFQDPFGVPFGFEPFDDDAGQRGPPRSGTAVATMDGGASASMGATEGENVPTDPPEKITIAEVSKPEPQLNQVFFGEKFVSFRSLMKRYMLANNYAPALGNRDKSGDPINESGDFHKLSFIIPNFPPFPGPQPSEAQWMNMTGNFNFLPPAQYVTNFDTEVPSPINSNTRVRWNTGTLTYFHYVTAMFVGWRGSIRNKYVLNGPNRESGHGGTSTFGARRLSASARAFGKDVAIGTLNENIYPTGGDRWNQGQSYTIMSHTNEGVTNPGVTVADFAMNINGGQLSGNLYAPNWTNNESQNFQSSQVTSNAIFGGSHVTTNRQQPAIEIELPFYEPTRFEFVDNYFTNNGAKAAHEVVTTTHRSPLDGDSFPVSTAFERRYLSRWVCPGEDFQCFYLLNAPIYFNNSQMIFDNGEGDSIRFDSVALARINDTQVSDLFNGASPYSVVLDIPDVFPPTENV